MVPLLLFPLSTLYNARTAQETFVLINACVFLPVHVYLSLMGNDDQVIVAWLHQRWVWHTTTLKDVSHLMFYEDLEVGRPFSLRLLSHVDCVPGDHRHTRLVQQPGVVPPASNWAGFMPPLPNLSSPLNVGLSPLFLEPKAKISTYNTSQDIGGRLNMFLQQDIQLINAPPEQVTTAAALPLLVRPFPLLVNNRRTLTTWRTWRPLLASTVPPRKRTTCGKDTLTPTRLETTRPTASPRRRWSG